MKNKINLLILEDHPIVSEMIENLIMTYDESFKIKSVENCEEALDHLKRASIHLIIANLQLILDLNSMTLLDILNGYNPPIPVLAIADENETAGITTINGNITVLHQPIDFEMFMEMIQNKARIEEESIVHGISLENFLQMLEQDGKTCTLRIMSGSEISYLYLQKGRLIRAQSGELQEKEAFQAILAWQDCTIHVSNYCRVEPNMNYSIQSLLLEWAIKSDETSRTRHSLEAA